MLVDVIAVASSRAKPLQRLDRAIGRYQARQRAGDVSARRAVSLASSSVSWSRCGWNAAQESNGATEAWARAAVEHWNQTNHVAGIAIDGEHQDVIDHSAGFWRDLRAEIEPIRCRRNPRCISLRVVPDR